MIFSFLKLIVWLAGATVIAYFALPYFGYEINLGYFDERKAACQEQLAACRKDLIKNGLDGAKKTCDWKCVDPKLIIKKQEKDAIMNTETGTGN